MSCAVLSSLSAATTSVMMAACIHSCSNECAVKPFDLSSKICFLRCQLSIPWGGQNLPFCEQVELKVLQAMGKDIMN